MFMNRLLNTSSSTGSTWCRRQALRARGRALQQQVVQRGQPRAPAGLEHRGGVALGDDGRAVMASPGRRSSRTISAASCQAAWPSAPLVYMGTVPRRGAARGGCSGCSGSAGGAGHHGLDRHGLDDQRLALHQEGKALAIGRLEGLGDGLQRGIVPSSPPASKGTTSAESVPS
jgi:hypothetical protein